MKMNSTLVTLKTFCVTLFLVTSNVLSYSQTYTTIANGAWTSASTWQGGNIPPATIPAGSVINIKHIVSGAAAGGTISNFGTIQISNPNGISPRLLIPNNTFISNELGGKIFINNAELRQNRFSTGGETGVPQTGSVINAGGYIEINNSFIEIAQNFENKNMGVRIIRNSSIVMGNDYKLTSNSFDTILNSAISVGWHGVGDFSTNGGTIYMQGLKVQIASAAGLFRINGSVANGDIDHISLRNHFTNTMGTGTITFSNSISTSGIVLDNYCALSPASLIPNGKLISLPALNCTPSYFPAAPLVDAGNKALNFSTNPVLVSGTALQQGAIYKYESVAPGVDVFVKIDSLINGATIYMLDNNSGTDGFIEGFQPQLNSGSNGGNSYAVFGFQYMVTGTNQSYKLDNFGITALDIDGTSTLKEFDEISMGTGATAGYVMSSPVVSFSQTNPGSFLGINTNGVTVGGVDTTSKQYMFTVNNSNVSAFTVKLGISNTQNSSSRRLFSIYMKGFNYPQFSSLPVKMEYFNATLNNTIKKVTLKWKSATEINLNHYSVERSSDGIKFNEIGLVFAAAGEGGSAEYQFMDDVNNISEKVVYYRLRSVDQDEKTQFSNIQLIKLSSVSGVNLNVEAYPNPVLNELRITIPAEWQNKQVSFEVIGLNGQVAFRKISSNSSQTEVLPVSNLRPGSYILRVQNGSETLIKKVIKQ